MNKRLTLFLGCLFTAVCFLFTGPSRLLFENEKLSLIIVGYFSTGIFIAFINVGCLPEMLRSAHIELEGTAGTELHDLASSLHNILAGFG